MTTTASTLQRTYAHPIPTRRLDPPGSSVPPENSALPGGSGAPGNRGPATEAPHVRPRLRLHREAEVPRRIAALTRGTVSATSDFEGDGQRPDELAGNRQEERQILAIARMVCQATAEVLVGLRQPQQLNQWLDTDVLFKITQRAGVMARYRKALNQGSRRRPPRLQFLSLRAEPVRRGAWEVSVVFADGNRARACAMRLQAHRKRWRVSALELG